MLSQIASIEKTNVYTSNFTGAIQGDDVVQIDMYGNRTAVGITNNKALELINENKELSNLLEQYSNKLIELGVIEKEKTPEEIMAEQNALMVQMSQTLAQVQQELSNLKQEKVNDTKHTGNNESGANVKSSDSKQPTRKSSINELTKPN